MMLLKILKKFHKRWEWKKAQTVMEMKLRLGFLIVEADDLACRRSPTNLLPGHHLKNWTTLAYENLTAPDLVVKGFDERELLENKMFLVVHHHLRFGYDPSCWIRWWILVEGLNEFSSRRDIFWFLLW